MTEKETTKNNWPTYFKDQLILGNKESANLICCLWTVKETMAEKIGYENFLLCGNLYSKEGIKYLLRNILSNPRARHLIVLGEDRTKSGDALISFFKEKQCPDERIKSEDFSKIIANVKIIDLRMEKDWQKIKNIIMSLPKDNAPWAEPLILTEEQPAEQLQFPSEISLFRVAGKTVADCWPWALKNIMRFGVEKNTDYGVKEKEILNLATVIYQEDPANLNFVDYFTFSEKEFLDYCLQILSPQKIPGISYTYGERLRNYQGIDQIEKGIVAKLKESINSRRALASTWITQQDIDSKQPPCLVLLQALCQNNKLHLTAYLRSNDIFKAWPQNCLALRKLQGIISQDLKIDIGVLTTISSSAHIYEQDFFLAENIISKYASSLPCSWDMRGNFIISLDKEKERIIACHYSPEGIKLKEYQGKTAREVYKKISEDLAISQVDHAFDLGIELNKAETALLLGKNYQQDNPILF